MKLTYEQACAYVLSVEAAEVYDNAVRFAERRHRNYPRHIRACTCDCDVCVVDYDVNHSRRVAANVLDRELVTAEREAFIDARAAYAAFEQTMRPAAEGNAYFVTACCAGRYEVIAGPFETNAEASRAIEPARYASEKALRGYWIEGWGTGSLPRDTKPLVSL